MNGRERRLLTILFIFLGLLLIAFFASVIYPTYKSMSKKADEQTDLKNQAEKQLREARALDEDEINNRLSNLKARVPSSLELPNVINRIDELAATNNLVWLQGTPEDVLAQQTTDTGSTGTEAEQGSPSAAETTSAPQLDRHDFTIVVSGDRNNFLKFMAGLTNKEIGRIVVINSLDLQFLPDGGPDAIQATLQLQVVGWQEGSSIDSSGCTQEDLTATTLKKNNDPKCNRTNVSKEESSD